MDVALVFTTDPAVAQRGFRLLTDDRSLEPSENVTPVVSRSLLRRYGDRLSGTVDAVSALLTTDELVALNRAVASGRPASAVAGRMAAAAGTGVTMDVDAGTGTDATPPGDRQRWREPVALPGLRHTGRRRRPSGKPPPLPRELGVSGKLWVIVHPRAGRVPVVLLFTVPIGPPFERRESQFLIWLSGFRTGWLTDVAKFLSGAGAEWPNRVARWAVIVVLVVFKRWRHLFVFVGTVLVVTWLVEQLQLVIGARPPARRDDHRELERLLGPSATVAAAAITGLGVLYTLLEPGRARRIGQVGVLVAARPAHRWPSGTSRWTTRSTTSWRWSSASPCRSLAYRMFVPNAVFPVAYRRGRSAHLDLGGRPGRGHPAGDRRPAGADVVDVKPFGLRGSGGSTPMRITVAGDPDRVLFGKLYAKTHLRADRWYKLGRTILYGSLEDEKAYGSVRRLVQYEDYVLRVMHDAGMPGARVARVRRDHARREYLLVTEFLEGVGGDQRRGGRRGVIDDALRTVRRMWEAGVAHRDVKPANIMVRDGRIVLIDLAFGELRPSPWRQAVDLANMMLVLGLRADPDLV